VRVSVATKTVELVHFQPENSRGTDMFRALIASAPQAGIDVIETTQYQGTSPWLLVWGPGAPARRDTIRAHVANGGRAIALDLAYWQRSEKVRVSFDAPHPQVFVMKKALPAERFIDDGITLTNEWNPDGAIVIAGLGDKARVQYGAGTVDEWERDMMRVCAARWPKRIIYRPKKVGSPIPAWATHVSREGRIEDALRGAALVITWHSNVAVDAIRMGIPAVCRDGAAAAVCRSTVDGQPLPLASDVRDRFLANLAWFQWKPSEAAACWRFIQESLS
jgi:hypothetical protein